MDRRDFIKRVIFGAAAMPTLLENMAAAQGASVDAIPTTLSGFDDVLKEFYLPYMEFSMSSQRTNGLLVNIGDGGGFASAMSKELANKGKQLQLEVNQNLFGYFS